MGARPRRMTDAACSTRLSWRSKRQGDAHAQTTRLTIGGRNRAADRLDIAPDNPKPNAKMIFHIGSVGLSLWEIFDIVQLLLHEYQY